MVSVTAKGWKQPECPGPGTSRPSRYQSILERSAGQARGGALHKRPPRALRGGLLSEKQGAEQQVSINFPAEKEENKHTNIYILKST